MSATTTVTGLHITGVSRLANSASGNPRFDIAFTDHDGQPHSYRTQSDASCNHDVTNFETEHRENPAATVAVRLSPAGHITHIDRETDGPVTITRDGKKLAGVADSNAAFAWLLRHQAQSVDHAIRYEGYRVLGPDGRELAEYAAYHR
jgi:hypothetical protein